MNELYAGENSSDKKKDETMSLKSNNIHATYSSTNPSISAHAAPARSASSTFRH